MLIHKHFGKGIITKENGNYIHVKFDGGLEKVFLIPESFETGLFTVDAEFQRRIYEEKKSISEEKTRMNQKSDDTHIVKNTHYNYINKSDSVENTFVFINKWNSYKNITGYNVNSSYGENVGIVWKHKHKKGELAEGQAEIRFYDQFREKYGTWRRIFINNERVMFDNLERLIKQNDSYLITIDPRRGS